MTDDIKEKAMMLAIQARPGRPAHELIDDAAQIEAYLREGEAEEHDRAMAERFREAAEFANSVALDVAGESLRAPRVKYRDAPAQSIALDEAEERDDD